MKDLKIIFGLFYFVFTVSVYGQTTQKEDFIPLAPKQNRRPENLQFFNYRYSLEELKANFSEKMMRNAAEQYQKVTKVNTKGKWKPTSESVDSHQTPEWFKDAKFGMFIDWGLWSVPGWAPKKENKAMYPDWYEYRMYTDSTFIKYHKKNWGNDFYPDDFIPLFTASNYQPDKLAKLAADAGMKYIIPFCKHHSGYCLWPSSFSNRNALVMGPKRDLIKPLVKSCNDNGLKFGFYFSLEEWEYPLIDNEGKLVNRKWSGEVEPYSKDMEKKATGKIAVKKYAEDYLVPQATEFIDQYDPDIIWYDGEWSTNVKDLKSYEISSYFYNNAEGRKEVAVNDRYGVEGGVRTRSRRGDFFTSEFHDRTIDNNTHKWEECRGISQSFGFNWQDTDENVISSDKFIEMFIIIVCKGGNLLLIVNLDGQGALPEVQGKRLKEIGEWLKVNGEGIYGTRTYTITSEGEVRYTRSKDYQKVYAITTLWPGNQLKLKSVVPKKESKIYMLGVDEPLQWYYDNTEAVTTISIPDYLQDELKRPCKYAYVFRIEVD